MTARTDYLYPRTVKGRSYLYFRFSTDGRLVRLPLDQKSAEFRRCYDACIKQLKAEQYQSKRVPAAPLPDDEVITFLPGAVGAGIEVYKSSQSYRDKKPSTKSIYNRVFDAMRKDRDFITSKLRDVDLEAVEMLVEEILRKMNPSFAAAWLTVMSNIWAACRKDRRFELKGLQNPTAGVEPPYKVKNPYQPWDAKAQKIFMEKASDRLKLAKMMLHYGGQRGGDTVRITWNDFDGRGFWVTPEKTNSNPQPMPNYHLCVKPLRDALLNARPLDKADWVQPILLSAWGKGYSSASALSHAINNEFVRLGLKKPGRSRNGKLTMHGLRKNAACDVGLLMLGASGIKSVTGHRSDQMANYYAEHADKMARNKRVIEAWDAALAAEETAEHEDATESVARRRAQIRSVPQKKG